MSQFDSERQSFLRFFEKRESSEVHHDRCSTLLPDCYVELQNVHEVSAILDIPGEEAHVNQYMKYRALHGMPIVQGRIARKLKPTLIDSPNPDDAASLIPRLKGTGVSHILYHKRFAGDAPGITVQHLRERYTAVFVVSKDKLGEQCVEC